jgi:hypothetical protein
MTGHPGRIRVRTTPEIELLARILAGTPKLDGALCRDRPALFDGQSTEDINSAIELCRSACPCLQTCAAWANTTPHLHGVIGEILRGGRATHCLECGAQLRRQAMYCGRRCQAAAWRQRRQATAPMEAP